MEKRRFSLLKDIFQLIKNPKLIEFNDDNASIIKIVKNIKNKLNTEEIKDLIRLSEAIILYSRGSNVKLESRIFLSTLCCFRHTNEEETLTIYMPSYWIIEKIYNRIKHQRHKKNINIITQIMEIIDSKDFPVVPKERLKLRIQNTIRRINEKNLFDYAYGNIDAAIICG